MNILLCHAQSEFRANLRKGLEKAFSRHRLTIDEASNVAAALQKVGERSKNGYHFLITGMELAENPDLSPDQARRGLALVEKVNQLSAKIRCLVLVSGEILPELAALASTVSCRLITVRIEKMCDDVIDAIRAANGKREKRRLSLKLVQDPNSSNWNFWLEGEASLGLQEQRGTFPIQQYFIQALRDRSERVLKPDMRRKDWLEELGAIGKDCYVHFFGQGNTFSNLFQKALKNAGSINRVRFCFNIRQDYYSLAIEAIVPPEKKKPASKLPFWMLKAPIYRTISVQNPSCKLGEEERPYLFKGVSGPINCLIIQADAAGKVRSAKAKIRKPFNPLLCVPEECEGLEKVLRKNQAAWNIGEIERISPGRSPKTFKKRLFELLATKTWHIVHFCGHSYYRSSQNNKLGTGYLILPGKPIEAVDAREFAHYLGKTQFLFLSSCESSEEAFAFEMARNRMPAVLGFRGGVDDRHVPSFVKTFYKRLFSSRSIESAFVATRKDIRKKRGVRNPLWASPMLVLMHPEEEKKPASLAASAGSVA